MKILISLFTVSVLAFGIATARADEASYGTTMCFVEVVPWKSASGVDDDAPAGTTGVGSFLTCPHTYAATPRFVTDCPDVSVTPLAPYFDLGTVATGFFIGVIPFWVEANCRNVLFAAAASFLYEGGDPDSVIVPPILLYMDDPQAGIDIIAHHGSPTGGHSNRALYTQQIMIDEFPGFCTEVVEFETTQSDHFSQQVDLWVTWIQDDPERPLGEYSGKVRLYCWGVPPTAAERDTWSRVKAMYR